MQGFQRNRYMNSMDKKTQIKVSMPQLQTAKGHFNYLVQGQDKRGSFQIKRRYNDFYYLREALKKKFSIIYIPPVPQKLIIGNKDQGNIQTRKKLLDFFLQRIAQNSHMLQCSITQQFLKNKSIDMQKFYVSYQKPNCSQIISLIKQIYPNLNFFEQENINPTDQQKKLISDFSIYLKKASKELKNIKNSIQSIVDSRNNFLNNLNICNIVTLPEYQKNVYSQYLESDKKQQGMIFARNVHVQQNAKKLKQNSSQNSFQMCLDLITYQIRQIQAMEQLLQQKINYQQSLKKCQQKLQNSQSELQKLIGGKTTLKSIFSKGNKDQQIKKFEKQIPQIRIQLKQLQRFCNSIIIILAEKQIPNFKKYKQMKYYQMVRITSQKQLNHLKIYHQLMKSVMDGLIKFK